MRWRLTNIRNPLFLWLYGIIPGDFRHVMCTKLIDLWACPRIESTNQFEYETSSQLSS